MSQFSCKHSTEWPLNALYKWFAQTGESATADASGATIGNESVVTVQATYNQYIRQITVKDVNSLLKDVTTCPRCVKDLFGQAKEFLNPKSEAKSTVAAFLYAATAYDRKVQNLTEEGIELEKIKEILDQALSDYQESHKEKCLHAVIKYRNIDVVKYLLKQHPNWSECNQPHCNPLQLAEDTAIPKISRALQNRTVLKSFYLKKGEKASFLVIEKDLSIDKIFTNPIIIKSAEQKGERVNLLDLFVQGDLKVICYGSSGKGKSALCQYIAYEWAQGNLWPEFTHLFWIQLHNLNKHLYQEGRSYTVADIVARECGLEISVAKGFLENPQIKENALLLLDGEDELPLDAASKKGHLHEAFVELKGAFSHVLVTSRPQPIVSVPSGSLELEIIGFDTDGIDIFVGKFFADAPEKKKLINKKLENPLVRKLAHTPINLEIFCSLIDQGESLFIPDETPTMTSIYKILSNWYYKRFLMNKKTEAVSMARGIFDARNHPDVKKKAAVLEEIAWVSMEQEALDLSGGDVEKICRKFDFKDTKCITELGLYIIEGGVGKFVHKSFQEYFAAERLARMYLEKTDVNKTMRVIKFESRYSNTLPMVAGCLSLKGDQKALQLFFNDLFEEPRDLAKGYELILFARCFEECLVLTEINQYEKDFIPGVLEHLKAAPLLSMGLALFNRNTQLLRHKQVAAFLLEALETQGSHVYEVDILSIANTGQLVPLNMVEILEEKAKDVLKNVVEEDQDAVDKALEEFISIVSTQDIDKKDREIRTSGVEAVALGDYNGAGRDIDINDREANVFALRDIAIADQDGADQALNALINMANAQDIDTPNGETIFFALAAVALRDHNGAIKALESLEKIVNNPAIKKKTRTELEPFIKFISLWQECPVKALKDKTVNFQKSDRSDVEVAFFLFFLLTDGQPLGEEEVRLDFSTRQIKAFLEITIETLTFQSFDRKLGMAFFPLLLTYLKKNQALSEEIRKAYLNLAMGIFNDKRSSKEDLEGACSALTELAKKGQTIPPEAIKFLIDIVVKDLIYDAKKIVISALEEIAKGRQPMPIEAVEILLKIASGHLYKVIDEHPSAKLRRYFEQKEAIIVLEKIFKEGEDMTFKSVKACLKIASNYESDNRNSIANFAVKRFDILNRLIEKDSLEIPSILRICAITQRPFYISAGAIQIGDKRNNVSCNVEGVDQNLLKQLKQFKITDLSQ